MKEDFFGYFIKKNCCLLIAFLAVRVKNDGERLNMMDKYINDYCKEKSRVGWTH